MVQHVTSRSQRRVEKKQALVMLALILAVSLVSFALGVVVGKSGSEEQVAQVEFNPPPKATVEPQEPVRQPVMPVTPQTSSEVAAEPTSPGSETVAEDASPDALPKVEQAPLGSGINLPPEEETPQVEEAPATPVTPVPTPKTKVASVPPKPVRSSAPAAAVASGQFIVQAASFKNQADANKLREKLVAKGFPAFVESADLGAKGVWHRVMLGPYVDRAVAGNAVDQLSAAEKLSGIVKKR